MTKDEMKAAFEEMHKPGAWDRLQRMQEGEKQAVMDLGEKIGFGRIMQLARDCWRERLERVDPATVGGEFAYGPCVALLVTCGCVEAGGTPGGCDWCCGTGKVTQKVREAMPTPLKASDEKNAAVLERIRTMRTQLDQIEAEVRADEEWKASLGSVFASVDNGQNYLCEPCADEAGIELGSPEVNTWPVGSDGWLGPIMCKNCKRSIPVVCDG